jgi:DNA-binding transcriptional regulator YiaG
MQGVSGLDLRVERVKRELRGVDVAARMGVSHQRVYQLEQMRRVPPELAERYLKALEASA